MPTAVMKRGNALHFHELIVEQTTRDRSNPSVNNKTPATTQQRQAQPPPRKATTTTDTAAAAGAAPAGGKANKKMSVMKKSSSDLRTNKLNFLYKNTNFGLNAAKHSRRNDSSLLSKTINQSATNRRISSTNKETKYKDKYTTNEKAYQQLVGQKTANNKTNIVRLSIQKAKNCESIYYDITRNNNNKKNISNKGQRSPIRTNTNNNNTNNTNNNSSNNNNNNQKPPAHKNNSYKTNTNTNSNNTSSSRNNSSTTTSSNLKTLSSSSNKKSSKSSNLNKAKLLLQSKTKATTTTTAATPTLTPMAATKIPPKRQNKFPTETTTTTTSAVANDKVDESFWDILKPFTNFNVSKDHIIDYITRNNINIKKNLQNNKIDLLKIAMAKYILEYNLHPSLEYNKNKVPKATQNSQMKCYKKLSFRKYLKHTNFFNDNIKTMTGTSNVYHHPHHHHQLQQQPANSPNKLIEIQTLFDHNLLSRSGVRMVVSENEPKSWEVKIPKRIEENYAFLSAFISPSIFQRLFRPKIYFDVEIKDNSQTKVGRLVFQLFTEACPALVMEFVKLAAENKFQDFHFRNVFQNLWIEGRLDLGKSNVLDRANICNRTRCIDHEIYSGVISFPESLLRIHSYQKYLCFNINLHPFKSTNHSFIPFGILTHGQWIIKHIQSIPQKLGYLTLNINIVKCGALDYI